MQFISCYDGQIHRSEAGPPRAAGDRMFATGLAALDGLLPGGAFARGAIHEILAEPGGGMPLFFALLLARSAAGYEQAENASPLPLPPGSSLTAHPPLNGIIAWCDRQRQLYPPALAAAGMPLHRVLLLRPTSPADEVWTIAECLRCKGVCATVAETGRLSRIEARRLQLAAETGGGVGLLLRPANLAGEYAAATRWQVRPTAGERTVQRWKVELVHGHGGCIGQSVFLEVCRETNLVRAVDKLADRPASTPATRVSA